MSLRYIYLITSDQTNTTEKFKKDAFNTKTQRNPKN